MKRFSKLLTFVFAVASVVPLAMVLTGCSSGVSRDNLIGEWSLTRMERSGHGLDMVITPGTEGWTTVAGTLLLREDDTFVDFVGAITFTGTWSLSGRQITFTHAGTTISETWTVTIDGGTMSKSRSWLGISETWTYTRL